MGSVVPDPEPLSNEWLRLRCMACHVFQPNPEDCRHPRVREVAAVALRWAAARATPLDLDLGDLLSEKAAAIEAGEVDTIE